MRTPFEKAVIRQLEQEKQNEIDRLKKKIEDIKIWLDENHPKPYYIFPGWVFHLRHGNFYHFSDVNQLIEGLKRILEDLE
jgi:hypothetical protein